MNSLVKLSVLEYMVEHKQLEDVTQLLFSIDLLEFTTTAVYHTCLDILDDIRNLGFMVYSKDIHRTKQSKQSNYYALSLVSLK